MAGDAGLGKEIRKIEKNSLQKFKNQNKALKKFGKPGLKVYRAIRKSGISIEELMEKTKVEQELLFEILTFLKENGMIETVGEAGEEPAVDEETEMVEPEGIIVEEEEKEEPPATLAPEEEIEAEEEPAEIEPVEEEEEEGPLAPSAEIEPEEEEEPAEIEPEEEEEPAEIEPAEEETPEEEGEGGILPLDLESEAEEKEEEPAEEETAEEEEAFEDEIAPSRAKKGKKEDEEEEEDEDIFLTPGERKIKAEYGQVGIDVYNLIDGQRTAEEIMKSTGVTETKLIEMLDFMEKKGIIKLEHPGSKKKVAVAPRAKMADVREVGFAPMLEEGATPVDPLGGELGKEFTLEVPTRTKGNMLKEIQIKANLMIKYNQPGLQVFERIDGNRDAVELALKIGIPLFRVYKILAYLEKEGMITLAPSNREDIKRKYGDDGYSVYKKYGREGVMLYQLIGKDMDLREMANQTSDDKKRVVEIFMFIHKILGIELPIDEDVLLERLESTVPDAK